MQRTAIGQGEIVWEKLKCVTLDVTGTLFAMRHRVGDVYASMVEWHGLDKPDADVIHSSFKASYKHVNRESPCVGGLAESTKEWWRKVVYRTFDTAGLKYSDPQRERIFSSIYSAYGSPKAYKLFDDVMPFLESAKTRGLKLGVISNESERYSEEILPGFGLSCFFEFVILAKDVLSEKPDRKIFEAAASAAGAAPEDILHIGDDYEKDCLGSLNAGFHSPIFLNRFKRKPEHDPRLGYIHFAEDLRDFTLQMGARS
eukprot:CAMPEP_0184753556 /NCGR_PEP_ID=MMETSP0315-20130426/44163_1 /TAXON_ID=101924 /ORGANISM="Rhodosorus marinus, Strain UTEX LB 2760" /LENGTH=256 /DNA_ID=CAMNT_0027232937 /DNA_START=652 /DNA_END=1422 /DNA_ORIENTATION=-